jgi:hypothetical protein
MDPTLMFSPARAESDAQKRWSEARATFYEVLHSSRRLRSAAVPH